jgi:phosphonate transport system substrate-binding protein
MKVRSWLAAPLAVGLLATACGGGDGGDDTGATDTGTSTETSTEASDGEWPEQLTLGFVPSREADKIVEDAQTLGDAISAEIGIPVETFVSNDYTALTEAMASGQADIGAFGPLGIVRAIDRAGVEFILQSERFGAYTYHTQYMTSDPDTYCTDEPQADEDGYRFCNGTLEADEGPAGEESIAAIGADTKLAYVDPTSASGYLIPALQLMEQGVDLDSLDSTFSGGHDASVIAVYNGDVEVGLSFDDARGTVAEEFPDVGEKVVVFAYSEEIPNDGFVIRGELPDDLKQAVTDAMIAYAETEDGQATLQAIYEIDGLIEADDSVLDVIRRADAELGDEFEG